MHGTQCRETAVWGGEQGAEVGGGAGAMEEAKGYAYRDYHQIWQWGGENQ